MRHALVVEVVDASIGNSRQPKLRLVLAILEPLANARPACLLVERQIDHLVALGDCRSLGFGFISRDNTAGPSISRVAWTCSRGKLAQKTFGGTAKAIGSTVAGIAKVLLQGRMMAVGRQALVVVLVALAVARPIAKGGTSGACLAHHFSMLPRPVHGL